MHFKRENYIKKPAKIAAESIQRRIKQAPPISSEISPPLHPKQPQIYEEHLKAIPGKRMGDSQPYTQDPQPKPPRFPHHLTGLTHFIQINSQPRNDLKPH